MPDFDIHYYILLMCNNMTLSKQSMNKLDGGGSGLRLNDGFDVKL